MNKIPESIEDKYVIKITHNDSSGRSKVLLDRKGYCGACLHDSRKDAQDQIDDYLRLDYIAHRYGYRGITYNIVQVRRLGTKLRDSLHGY